MLLSKVSLHSASVCVCVCASRQIPSFCVALLRWSLALKTAIMVFGGGRYIRKWMAGWLACHIIFQ